MLQLFAGMTPGGGVENTWERILELPTSVAIPGVLSYFFILAGHSSHKLIDCDVQSAFLSGTEYCCSTINSTCLVAAQCTTIFVWKFYEGP